MNTDTRPRLRILHVIGGLAPRAGGPTNAMLPMCRALASRGHDVRIICTNGDWPRGTLDVPTGRPVYSDGVEVTYYPVQWHRYSASLPLAGALRSAIPDADVVHIHSLYLFHTTVAAHYARRYRKPYVIRPHGTLDPYQRRRSRVIKAVYDRLFEHRNLRKASAIHYMTDEERRRSETAGRLAPGVVVPHGLYLQEYRPSGEAGGVGARYGVAPGKRLITFLGRITPKKGLDLLARAWGQTARAWPDAHLVIAGPDDEGYGAQVQRWLAEEGVLDRVTFAGMVAGQDKVDLLHESYAFVLPSYFENFGLTVIEALACRTPVVISNEVYTCHEVERAHAGIVIDTDTPSLVAALNRLLEAPEQARAMGERGRALVESGFTWDVVAGRLEDLYFSVIAQGRQTPHDVSRIDVS